MASSVRFGKFKWDRAGYAAVMNSGGCQAVVGRKARAVKAAADGMLSADGYRYPGHEIKSFQGVLARGMVVRTKTDHARYAQAKRKTLTKAMNSIGGS